MVIWKRRMLNCASKSPTSRRPSEPVRTRQQDLLPRMTLPAFRNRIRPLSLHRRRPRQLMQSLQPKGKAWICTCPYSTMNWSHTIPTATQDELSMRYEPNLTSAPLARALQGCIETQRNAAIPREPALAAGCGTHESWTVCLANRLVERALSPSGTFTNAECRSCRCVRSARRHGGSSR